MFTNENLLLSVLVLLSLLDDIFIVLILSHVWNICTSDMYLGWTIIFVCNSSPFIPPHVQEMHSIMVATSYI